MGLIAARPPRIALWGTFDVDNYGDRVFPLVARHELRRRLPGAVVDAFAPYGGAGCEALGPWGEDRLDELASRYDCVVIGGGEIIHLNDAMLAPVYGVGPSELADVMMPSRFFVEALGWERERSCPVVWHGVGVPVDLDDARASRVRAALAARPYVSVRDARSRARLRAAGVERDIAVVPDSALLVDRVIDVERARGGDGGVVVQGCDLLVPYVEDIARALPAAGVTIVETGRCRGDAVFADALASLLGGRARRAPADLDVRGIASLLASARLVVSSSLHAAITAVVHGRPFVIVNPAGESKLDAFGDEIGMPGNVVRDPASLGRALDAALANPPGAMLLARLQRGVDAHFDRIAAVAGAAASEVAYVLPLA